VRIAIFTNAYKPAISGVVTSISLFRQGLHAAGHETHIFAPDYEDDRDEEPYVFRLPALDLSEQLNVSIVLPLKSLVELTLRGLQPAIIHSQHPVWMGDLAASFARELGLPLIFTFHTQYEQYARHYSPIAGKLAGHFTEERVRRYLQQCRHIIAPTESIRTMLASKFGFREQVSVIPTPVDLDRFRDAAAGDLRARLGLENREVLLYVGRIAREKGLDLLLRAFAQVHARRPQTRLLLVGSGPYQDGAEHLRDKLGLDAAVIFVGAVPYAEIAPYYAAADLFVFSSTTETQGLVLLESLAAGTPVVAVSAPGAADALKDGGGHLTEATDDDFAQGIVRVLEDEGQLSKLRQEAPAVAERYSIDATTRLMIEVYEKVLAKSQVET
jgi:glycosyltransferase involved in cell wall biosynthesis